MNDALPDAMRAVAIREPGGPDVLEVVERPLPEPGEGEVLIRCAAAGVNRPDCLQRQGRYPPPAGASDLPGLEVSGTVMALGGDVHALHPGDRVCALLAGGGYAEYCVAPAPQCLPVPQGTSLVDAAGIPETFFTVWTNVFDRGRLKPGESLLVHGGASGIGTTAIQMAKALGSRVYTTVSSAAKAEVCRALGAELIVNYRESDFVEEVKSHTQGHGVDVILDMVGGDYTARNLGILAVDGRLVQIAFLKGPPRFELDYPRLMLKRQTLTGSTLRARSIAEKGAIASALLEHVWPLMEAGRISPRIHRALPLEQASEAHRMMESSEIIGKVVLTMEPG